jgi:hypothetical protein
MISIIINSSWSVEEFQSFRPQSKSLMMCLISSIIILLAPCRDFHLTIHNIFQITNLTTVKDDSPLIPYCKAFFGLAVQDEAAFQYVIRPIVFLVGIGS